MSRELADGDQPILQAGLLLEAAQLGEVLEVHDPADHHLFSHVAQRRHGDADRQRATIRGQRQVGAVRFARGRQRGQPGHQRLDRTPGHQGRLRAQDVRGGAVRGEHGALGGDRDQPRGQRPHDVLVERQEVGGSLAGARERLGPALELVAEDERQRADAHYRRVVDAERADQRRRALVPRVRLRGHREINRAAPREQRHQGHRRDRGDRHEHGTTAVRQRARRDDRERVEERVRALRAARRRRRAATVTAMIRRLHRPRDPPRLHASPQQQAEHD